MTGTAYGYRAEDAADRRKPNSKWPAKKIATSNSGTVKFSAASDGSLAANQSGEIYTQADERKLDGIGQGKEVATVQATAAEDVDDLLATRDPNAARRLGSFAGDEGDADYRIIQIGAGGDALSLTMTGPIERYAGLTFFIGERKVPFSHAVRQLPDDGNSVFEFAGDYSNWMQAGTAIEAGVLEPLAELEKPTSAQEGQLATAVGGKAAWRPKPSYAYDEIGGEKPPVDAVDFNAIDARTTQKIAANKRYRFAVIQHENIAAQPLEISFPAYTPIRQRNQQGAFTGRTTGGTSASIPGVGRITFYPSTALEAEDRGAFEFTPQSQFARDFGANSISVATAADGTDRQDLALTANQHGTLVSAQASAANQVPLAGGHRWIYFSNASGGIWPVNSDDVQYRTMDLAQDQFGKELLARLQPIQESVARPQAGWTNAGGNYADVNLLPDLDAVDDNMFVRFGVTGYTGYGLPAAFGSTLFTPWLKAQRWKAFARLASPFAGGGEAFYPKDLRADESYDWRAAPNAFKIVAHNRFELYIRAGADGRAVFRDPNDSWARYGSFVSQQSYLPFEF